MEDSLKQEKRKLVCALHKFNRKLAKLLVARNVAKRREVMAKKKVNIDSFDLKDTNEYLRLKNEFFKLDIKSIRVYLDSKEHKDNIKRRIREINNLLKK